MEIGIASVAAITVVCYLVGLIVKASCVNDRYIPIACGLFGGLMGVAGLYLGLPDFPAHDPLTALAVGIVSGLAAPGGKAAGEVILSRRNRSIHLRQTASGFGAVCFYRGRYGTDDQTMHFDPERLLSQGAVYPAPGGDGPLHGGRQS